MHMVYIQYLYSTTTRGPPSPQRTRKLDWDDANFLAVKGGSAGTTVRSLTNNRKPVRYKIMVGLALADFPRHCDAKRTGPRPVRYWCCAVLCCAGNWLRPREHARRPPFHPRRPRLHTRRRHQLYSSGRSDSLTYRMCGVSHSRFATGYTKS